MLLLTRIAGTAVEPLLTEAIEAGVLVEDPWAPARLRFAHELVRDARYAELSRTERVGAHRRIAEALDESGASAGDTARHRVRAVVDDESRALARAAWTAGEQVARAELLAHQAFLLVETGQQRRAEPISRQAMALAEATGDPPAMAAAVHARHRRRTVRGTSPFGVRAKRYVTLTPADPGRSPGRPSPSLAGSVCARSPN